jgi:hypothetical protein
MKAIVIRAYGGHEVMKLDDVELPAPGAGEALVDVAVSGVNFMDTGTRRGYTKAMHTLPMTPGVEGAGTVVAVGDGVTNVKVGDRVAWFFSWGSYAQQVIAPAAQLAPLPDDIDDGTRSGSVRFVYIRSQLDDARRRIERWQEMLIATDMTLVNVALAVGFRAQSHYSNVFKRFVGQSPCAWLQSQCDDKGLSQRALAPAFTVRGRSAANVMAPNQALCGGAAL